MHNILKKLIKVKKYTLIKQKLKICLIFVLLLSSGCLFPLSLWRDQDKNPFTFIV